MLTNVSYRRYKPEDVEKTNFVIYVFSFLTQNLNPSRLDRKLKTSLERDYIKMIWDSCVPLKFSKFIYQKENFIELSQPHITYQKVNNIILKFVDKDAQNIDLLKSALRDHLRQSSMFIPYFFQKSTAELIGLEQTTNRILILFSPIVDTAKVIYFCQHQQKTRLLNNQSKK